MSRYLAIDIDQQAVFVAAGTARGGAAKVEHALAWADDAMPPLTADTAKGYGERLKEHLKTAGIAAGPVLVAVGRDKVILKELRYPAVPPVQEPALVKFQAMKELTESPDDVVLDYAPLANARVSPDVMANGRGVTPTSFSPAAAHIAWIALNTSFRTTTAIDRRSASGFATPFTSGA